MYGLSSIFDVSKFKKNECLEINFTINTVNISFGPEINITIIGSFAHKINAITPAIKQTFPILSSRLMSLLGKKVKFAERGEDGGLILHFDEGQMLILFDDSQEYESYIVRIGNEEIII